VQESDLGSSLLAPLEGKTSQWLTPKEVVDVHSVRLDTFLRSRELNKIALLKTDAQGLDGQVVESAGEFLQPDVIQAILVEMNFHTFYEGQEPFFDVIKTICERGYFLAEVFRHYNRVEWLWWADVLFLPNKPPYTT
jgi:hypothetical protein